MQRNLRHDMKNNIGLTSDVLRANKWIVWVSLCITLFVCSLFRFDGFVYRMSMCALCVGSSLSMLVAVSKRIYICIHIDCVCVNVVYTCVCESFERTELNWTIESLWKILHSSFHHSPLLLLLFVRLFLNVTKIQPGLGRTTCKTHIQDTHETTHIQFIFHLNFKRYNSLLYGLQRT